MKIKVVKYGRTIEVGRFGRGPSGRVWFGWEVELEEGETEGDAQTALHKMADEREKEERAIFAGFVAAAFERGGRVRPKDK